MSTQAEIQRIKDNVTATLEALADKSVTVPAESKSDDLAALISSIEGEGALINYGSIKLTAWAKNLTITHGLGKVPNFVGFVVFPSSNTADALATACRTWGWVENGTAHDTMRIINSNFIRQTSTFDVTGKQTSSGVHNTAADSATATAIVLGNSVAVSVAAGFAANKTIHYVIGVV